MSDYRKLRTIYDALDAHNFKQSLKLCDAALKKAADTSMVKALKAVTLERMGRTEEGLKLARDVASALAPPADDHLLSTLNIVFKATGHSAEGAAAYASAFEQEPKNEELGASLFGAWLREREYAKAQQLMMKMCAARNSGATRRAIRRTCPTADPRRLAGTRPFPPTSTCSRRSRACCSSCRPTAAPASAGRCTRRRRRRRRRRPTAPRRSSCNWRQR